MEGFLNYAVAILAVSTAVFSAGVAWGTRSIPGLKKEMQDVRKKIHDMTELQNIMHNQSELTAQRLKDHQTVDDERFGRIEEMFREMREDIKSLLKDRR